MVSGINLYALIVRGSANPSIHDMHCDIPSAFTELDL